MKQDLPRDPREFALFRYFTGRHVFTNLVTAIVFLVGIFVAVTITKEAFPQIDFDMVIISTPFRGAVPEEVEQLVTVPLERAVKGIDGIDKMESWSVEGNSVILLRLDPDHPDKKKTIKDIERAVDQIRNSKLPEGGDEPNVVEITHNQPVLNVDLSGAPEKRLREVALQLEDDLVELEGVALAAKKGYRSEQIWVEADENKLSALHLSLTDLIDAVRSSNHTSPGGRMLKDGQEILVRTMGRLQTVTDVGDVVVRSNSEGERIRIKDVAVVRESFNRETRYTRVNGTKSLQLSVQKKPSGDSLKVAKLTRELVGKYEQRFPDVSFTYSDDVTFYIQRRLNVLLHNGTSGIILVLISLFFFLSPVSAIFTTLAIPFAFLGGLICMYALGYTVNLLTMFSFILVSGMLVDDGVVISEFYEAKRDEGLPPFEAAVVGTSQMAIPVTVAVLTTIVAFSPLAYVSGILGKFLRQFPIVVVLVLTVDLIECLFILPSHLALFASKLRFPAWVERVRAFGPRTIQGLEKRYTPILKSLTKRPLVSMCFFVFMLASSLVASKFLLKFHMFPVSVDEFFVSIEMPVGTSLDKTAKAMQTIESSLLTLPKDEVNSIITEMGVMGDENNKRRGSHFAQSRIVLDQSGRRTRDGTVILKEVRPEIEAAAKRLGVVNMEITQRRSGPPSGKAVEVRLSGNSFETLSGLSDEVQAWLNSQEGVFGVKDDFTPGKEELLLTVDVPAVANAGLTPSRVAQVVRAAFDGEIATEIQRADAEEDIEVLIKLPESARGRQDTIERVRVTNPKGHLVPLSQLVTAKKGKGYLFIPRAEGKRTITVSGDLDQELTSSHIISTKLAAFLKERVDSTPGVRWEFVGEEKDRVDSVSSL
ncbi:MAG: hypothetical protein COB53_04625, partial [Elusimicrobia bacterium]